MDLTLLETLKEKARTATVFADVWNYFFDHFGETPDFFKHGRQIRDPFLEAVLTEVGRQLFGKNAKPKNVLLVRLPEYEFIHGTCLLEGRLATVIYFEDLAMGLLAVPVPPETKIVRFTGQPLREPPKPSSN